MSVKPAGSPVKLHDFQQRSVDKAREALSLLSQPGGAATLAESIRGTPFDNYDGATAYALGVLIARTESLLMIIDGLTGDANRER